ncbi:MAG: hypothetical protein ISR76_01685 [Planctomycetes bacterium]|nr:hypothetical protein [Planctomycetota bacterium]MBL7007681.1 hypothetical protein [Planctomycetota bacterium]
MAAPAVAQDPPPAAQESVHVSWNTQDRVADPTPVRFRIGFEQTTIDPSEDLGLLGMHLDFLEPLEGWPGIFFGLGGFTAVDGYRGGFLAGGLEGGLNHHFSDSVSIDAGIFVGVGGGHSVPNGTGVMLREHLGGQYQVSKNLGLRLEFSNIDFPNGTMGDFQLGVGAAWTMAPWVARNEVRAGRVFPAAAQPEVTRLRFSAGGTFLLVDSSSKYTNGKSVDADISLVGGRADLFLDDNLFLALSAGGALVGDIQGYAQVLTGVGYSMPIDERFSIEGTFLVGGAGGGGADTGGGLVVQPGIGGRIHFHPQVSGGVTLSRLMAVDGDFDATGIGFDLAFSTGLPDYKPGVRGVLLPDQTSLSLWVVEVMHRSYFPREDVRLDTGRDMGTMHELGLGLAFPLTTEMELTAQFFGAYEGAEDAYAEGWLGGRYRHHFAGHPSQAQWHLILAGAMGMGGGGNVSNGDGAMWDMRGGVGFTLSPTVDLDLTLGRTAAVDGDFDAWSFQGGLSWRFGVPVTKG